MLDALNYIKDKLDGSSDVPMVLPNGNMWQLRNDGEREPKLTCATFLSQYLPGPVRVEPFKNFPVLRDLVVEMSDFIFKLSASKTLADSSEGAPLAEREYLQTPEQLEAYRQYSMCINACCATPPARSTGWIPFSADRRQLPSHSVTTWTPVIRDPANVSNSVAARRNLGLYVCR